MTDREPQAHPGLSRRQVMAGGLAGLSAMALSGLLAACSSDSGSKSSGSSSGTPGGGKAVDQMTWALFADPVSMDYAFAYDFNTNPVVLNMCESLLRVSADGKLEPWLAESWEMVDEVTYVYTLRPNVPFHDGTTMAATDAVASMKRIMDPDVGSYLGTFVANVDSITASGPLEVTVKLKSADSLWQYVPATTVGCVSPEAFLTANGKKVGDATVGIVGTGPYRFDSWQQGQQVTLVRNEDYWNADRQPKVDKVVFKTVASEVTVVSGMAAGEIDGAFNISGKSLQGLKNVDSMAVVESPSYFVHWVGLNVTRGPFTDVRVRQALSMAIDKQGILDSTWGGRGELSKSPSTPAMWSFETEAFQAAYDELPDFALDIEKAKAMVTEAGAEGATATLLVPEQEKDAAVIVQAAGKSIGLDLKLQAIPYDQLLAKISDPAHDYDGLLLEWASDYPDPAGTLFQCFATGNSTNYTSYDNADVNAALKAAAVESDPAERAKHLIAAQKQIVEDQTWIIMFSPSTTMTLSTSLGGYQLRPLWFWDSGWAADISGT